MDKLLDIDLYKPVKEWIKIDDEDIKYIAYKYANELDKLRKKNT